MGDSMCQLLGMNCNTPTDILFSFEGFRKRGGETDIHTDGFGIAFFEGKGVRIYQDDKPCASSPVADLVKSYQIKSKNVIAHIRKATYGQVSLANTHPFMREIWGEYWLFAHNGHLDCQRLFSHPLFQKREDDFYTPVGSTDSEAAFCAILNALRRNFPQKPTADILFQEINRLTATIRKKGIFNYLLTNGEWMIAHASTLLHYLLRQAPFGEATLLDDDVNVNFAAVTTPYDKVAVIATLPLTTNEVWQQLAKDEIVMFQEGKIIARYAPDPDHYFTVEEALALAAKVGAAAAESDIF